MRKILVLAGAVVLAAQASVFAGYTATTGVNTVLTPAGPLPGAQIGDTFTTVVPGNFTSFIGDTSSDPTVTTDLNFYRYLFDGTVSAVNGTEVDYTGTYRIFYDLNLSNSFDAGDPSVSSGDFTLAALFNAPGTAVLNGSLTQTAGPTNPAFTDLGLKYGGAPTTYTGVYLETDPGVSGTISGTLRQAAAVPEPSIIGLLAAAPLAMGRRRR